MRDIDWNIYAVTSDREEGPMILEDMSGDDSAIKPFTDEDGNVTLGGEIGYALAYILMLAFFLVGYFVISSN